MCSINVYVINHCNIFDHLYPNKDKLRIVNTFTKRPKYQALWKTFDSLPHTHTHTRYYSVSLIHQYPQLLSVTTKSPAHVSDMKYVAVTLTRYDGTDRFSVH